MGVFDDLIGQQRAVAILERAIAGRHHAMTHAWLIVGPAGSGRSNAARAFAAALQCARGGCGVCHDCRTSLSGAHPDVTVLRTEKISIGVEQVRELAATASSSPVRGKYQVLVVEDADRITERGADALLKSLEEPAPRTVWLLCAPAPDDVIITIRSRCRELRLVTPPIEAVAELLTARDGVDPALAAHCARVSQGHIGRARALARNEQMRIRRHEVLTIASQLHTLSDCFFAAQRLVTNSLDDAESATKELDAQEIEELQRLTGSVGLTGAKARHAQAAMKRLTDEQKMRAKRIQRDSLDAALTELTGFYRDVIVHQTAPGVALINADLADEISAVARSCTPEHTVRALDALLEAREALDRNVSPLLAMEALMVELARSTRHKQTVHH